MKSGCVAYRGANPQPNRPLGIEFEPRSLQFLQIRFDPVRKSSKPGTRLDRFYLKTENGPIRFDFLVRSDFRNSPKFTP